MHNHMAFFYLLCCVPGYKRSDIQILNQQYYTKPQVWRQYKAAIDQILLQRAAVYSTF